MEILGHSITGLKRFARDKYAKFSGYGSVSFDNVSRLKVGEKLIEISSTLENYAKAKKINLEFNYNPKDAGQKLNIVAKTDSTHTKSADIDVNGKDFVQRIYSAVQKLANNNKNQI